jgi:hypothetical protein
MPRVGFEPTSPAGRAIAQAVSRWLSTAAARVQTRVQSFGICGGQSGAGAGFLRVLRFPLPIFIPPISPQSPSPIIRGWYSRPVVAAVPKVLPRKLKKITIPASKRAKTAHALDHSATVTGLLMYGHQKMLDLIWRL